MTSLVRKLTALFSSNNTNQQQQKPEAKVDEGEPVATDPAAEGRDAKREKEDTEATRAEKEDTVNDKGEGNSEEEGTQAGYSSPLRAGSGTIETDNAREGENEEKKASAEDEPRVKGAGAKRTKQKKKVTLRTADGTRTTNNESDEKKASGTAAAEQRERRPTLVGRLRTHSLANIFKLVSAEPAAEQEGALLDPADAEGPAERDGLLFKEGGQWKTWKQRWFILKNAKLFYRAADSTKLLGKIDLLNAKLSLEERYTNPEFEMRTCLVITCREATRGSGGAVSPRKQVVRKYYLFAEAYFATGKWLEAMKLSVARVAREERRRMRAESCEAASGGGGRGDAGLTSSGRLWTSSTLTPTARRPDGAKNEEETTTRGNEEEEQEEKNEPAEQRENEENTPEAPADASSEPVTIPMRLQILLFSTQANGQY
ncbi:uncharacterized protein ACA1_065830 [Acanthamoeba castellanii str. Neff]|uniref:PH domain-containing protein n=1 Tax=Acanthamoeba castellanii (strain ATCC 30010 / Neff) TaxID=1257118 RepID=L8GYZ9_ACACF|nr:uncharacterized protein ACA1_065830 [Acanthamoeba castellanii str. Neff]ELR17763.1 hypothetical protein ACA1_065830 [Acanthamoeba castellanii str. Neff]